MRLEEKTVDSKRIYDGRIVSLRIDTVRLPDGRHARREVVEHKGAVAIVPLLDSSKVVMVKQFRQPTGQVIIEIPAGTLDKPEEVDECAKRELIEEIGYSAGKLTKMFSTYLSPGYSDEMMHTFLAEDLTPAKSETDEDEFLEVITVELEDAVDMILTGEIKDAKTVCGLLMAQRIINGRK
ncbi:MAG TPA: NUDIX hydrolase [Armatimonadota bacterium]|jgi:ADP-ribose pyrophosphatase|nr:NUDIX hydrolase [Armatimonadota bacterium]HOM73147.1 NUDIX hydrolase [Armatimonadota bacterium]HOP79325.1 NUDIX hydrolase [Armatimonadota bacterium]HPP76187.1 NUDIX hydrolase [Armatimonadota bacterium]